jgi:outer membrane protein
MLPQSPRPRCIVIDSNGMIFMRGVAIVLSVAQGFVTAAAAPSAAVSLNDAFLAALEKNETVRQTGEQVVQADERIARLKGGLFPELSLNASRLFQPAPNDLFREFSPPQQSTVNLTVTQPIFRGLREFAGLRQQKRLMQAQEFVQKQATQRLFQEVASNYLNVLTLEQDLRNLQEQIDIYERRVEEIRARTRRGESSTSELLSTQATRNSLLAETRLVKGQLHSARETFFSLTGKDRAASLKDPELIPGASTGKSEVKKVVVDKVEEYLSRIEMRPDVQSAVAQRDAADEGIAISRGAHLPVIDAVGNYYLERPGFLRDLDWDFTVRFSLPLFSGGATQAQVRESASRYREAELELARVRRLSEEEIRTLHEALQARLEHLSLLRESVELAEKNVSISQSEYRRGLVRSIDVQAALAEYRMIRRSLDQARFAAQMDLLRLDVAAGLRPES